MRTGVGGATLRFDFRLFDSSDAAVTTAVSGDFVKYLTIDGVDDATAITVTHVANGRYTVTVTAPSVAAGSKKYVSCFVSHATHAPRGFAEDFEVTNADTSTGVAQTGDSFARLGATGSGLTSLAQASVATEARLARLDENVSAAKTLTAAERNAVADAALVRDLDQVEASAAIHSLASALLKLVSRFDSQTGKTYRTNGSTLHMTQVPVLDSNAIPVSELGVAT